jgi:hypothetical protein
MLLDSGHPDRLREAERRPTSPSVTSEVSSPMP